MAVQKFKGIKGYDNLEKFSDEKIPAFSLFIDKVLSRTYCSCGKSYAKIREHCDCGNLVTKHFEYDLCKDNLKFYVRKEVDEFGQEDGKLIFGYKQLLFDGSSNYPSYMTINLQIVDIFSVTKNNFEKLNPWPSFLTYYNFDNFVKANFENWIYFDECKFWYEKIICFSSVEKAIKNSLNFDKLFPDIYKDSLIYQYPYLISYCLPYSDLSSYKSFDDYFINKISKNLKDMDIFNSFIQNIYTDENLNKYIREKNIFPEKVLKDYNKILSEKNTFYGSYIENSINLIEHYVSNHLLNILEAVEIIYHLESILDNPEKPATFPYTYKYSNTYWHKDKDPYLKDFFKAEYLKFFDIYLKENVSIIKNKIDFVFLFIERIRQMYELKIPIKEDNFKTKNYNWLITSINMSNEYKLPKDKVNLFLDMFENDPLESINLISNRRKLNQKQIDDFIEKITKK